MTHSTTYQNAVLHYTVFGNGPKSLLAFHGFGQGKEAFEEFSQAVANDYTVYSFDLFFHGKSEWNYGEAPLEKEFWNQILDQFLSERNIQTFDIIGYSMGGKFALATVEQFSKKINNLFLLAPDGIWISPWYTLATGTLRNLFKSMILKPKRFEWIARSALTLGLIDKSLLRFTETQMNTEKKREQVFYSWIVFRLLIFDLKRIATLLNSSHVVTTVVIGERDRIFPIKRIKTLSSLLIKFHLHVVESGHNNLIRKSIPLIHAKMKSNAEGNR